MKAAKFLGARCPSVAAILLFCFAGFGRDLAAQFSINCSGAGTVGPGVYSSNNLGLVNTDGSSTCGGSQDVWVRYDPPSDGVATFSTCDDFTFLDTVVSVHTACPGGAANQVGCNDQDASCLNGNQSSVSVSVTGTSFYYVRIAGFGGASGNFTLTITQSGPPAPSNNACANAEVVTTGTNYSRTNVSATTDGSSTCGGNDDVWFRYTPATTGVLTVSTCGSAIDTVLSVHSACVGGAGNQLACNDDFLGCGTSSQVMLAVTAGVTYRIRVASKGGVEGSFQLLLTQTPPNDSCASATVISPGTINGTTATATTDGADKCDTTSGKDVWYSYTPMSESIVFASLCGSSYDTVLSVHQACPGSGLNQTGCDDNSYICGPQSKVAFLARSGTTYLIRVAGKTAASGNFSLNLSTVECGDQIYSEDFESGLNGWTIDNAFGPSDNGLWHLTTSCNAASAGHSPPTAMGYMVDGACNYTSPTATSGAIVSPLIDLTGPITQPVLRFNYFLETEGVLSALDQALVEVSTDGFSSSTVLATNRSLVEQTATPTGTWGTYVADLTPFDGQLIQLRFQFDTGTNTNNGFDGFYVDDILVCSPMNAIEGWEHYD